MLATFALLTSLAAPLPADTVIARGDAIPATAATVSMAEVLTTPTKYTKSAIVVEGVIVRSCTSEGCWMQLAPTKDDTGVRVTFKDHGFFIPLNAAGMKARAHGIVTTTKHSKAEADHLIGEGAKLVRNADGTAIEVAFIATGVELRKQ